MIKIAFVIDTILSPTGGTEKHILTLLENLDRKKFMPHLCVLRPSEWLETEFDTCPVSVAGIHSFRRLHSYPRIRRLARFLDKEGIDIVHTFFRDAGIAGILAGRLAGTRAVISARRNQGYWLNRKELIAQKFLNRWVSLFIANSYSTKAWSIGAEGVSAEKVKVVYNGIDLGPYKAIPGEVRGSYRKMLGIPSNAKLIGIVANLRPVKGIDIFLKAARLVKNSLPDARFVITGDGEEEGRLKALSGELGLTGSIHFLGRRRDIVQVLSMLDVAVLSSHSESFSNSLVEYLAAGLPVVCTDAGGGREAIEHGVNGFIVPRGDFRSMADRIIEIVRGGLSPVMSMRNREKAERKFSLPRFLNVYEDIYSGFARTRAERYLRATAAVDTKAE